MRLAYPLHATSCGPMHRLRAANRSVKIADSATVFLTAAFTADRSTASTSYVELNSEIRNEFLTWGDEAVQVHANLNQATGTASMGISSSLGFDGTTPEDVFGGGTKDRKGTRLNSSH